jgi:L-ascorbate metabolism protein UlaG (beta-lactamase superfamily)
MALTRDLQVTYFGHATFLFRSPKGKIVLIDPWVQGNPACPPGILDKVDRIDLMLVTHGHFDHIGDARLVAQQFKPRTVGIFEICNWLGKKGVENLVDMNKGGTVDLDGIRVTMVHADHSCGILDDDGSIVYGGEAVGYVVEFENGFKIYHAGDTNVFGDRKIIADLYRPDVVFLPIGDHYTMSPREAAYAIRLMKPKKVVPMHFATFPVLAGTPDELKKLTQDVAGTEIVPLAPGETRE